MKIKKKSLLSPKTFNILYSIGASIVILGALFKLLHVDGADTILIIGMGTEALIFFVSAFDEPAKEPNWENVYPGIYDQKTLTEEEKAELVARHKNRGNAGGGTVIIGDVSGLSGGNAPANVPANVAANVAGNVADAASVNGNVPTVIGSATPGITPEQSDAVTEATTQYVEQLKAINESLAKVQAALSGMNENSSYTQQMETLSRSIQGLNTMYELQLRSLSSQMSTIEEVRLERDQLANNLKQMNEVYTRMLQAMTVNAAPKI